MKENENVKDVLQEALQKKKRKDNKKNKGIYIATFEL